VVCTFYTAVRLTGKARVMCREGEDCGRKGGGGCRIVLADRKLVYKFWRGTIAGEFGGKCGGGGPKKHKANNENIVLGIYGAAVQHNN
jgi:hypothetical protein